MSDFKAYVQINSVAVNDNTKTGEFYPDPYVIIQKYGRVYNSDLYETENINNVWYSRTGSLFTSKTTNWSFFKGKGEFTTISFKTQLSISS